VKADLERRIGALEAKKAPPLSVWCVFIIPAGIDDEAILGYQYDGCVVMRELGETLESLQMRTEQGIEGSAVVIIQPVVENRGQSNDPT